MRLTFSVFLVCRDVTKRASLPPSVASGQLRLEHPGLRPSGPETLSLLAFGQRGRGPSICPSCLSVTLGVSACALLPALAPLCPPRGPGTQGTHAPSSYPPHAPSMPTPKSRGPASSPFNCPLGWPRGWGVGAPAASVLSPLEVAPCGIHFCSAQEPRLPTCSHQPPPRGRGGEEPQTLPGRCPGTPVSQSLDLVCEGSQDCPGAGGWRG